MRLFRRRVLSGIAGIGLAVALVMAGTPVAAMADDPPPTDWTGSVTLVADRTSVDANDPSDIDGDLVNRFVSAVTTYRFTTTLACASPPATPLVVRYPRVRAAASLR